VDTAGVRHTEDRVEQIGIERTTRAIEEADLTCVLLDGTAASGQEEQVLLDKLKELARPYFVAINKIDLCGSKPMNNGNVPDLVNYSIGKPLAISAKMGEGIEDLKGMIEHFALTDNSVKELGGSLNERQGALCIKAVEALERLLAASVSGLPQDCLASDLKLAVDALDAISGQVVTEEVITEVFANFCIGK
jgi:tRNA modification GTPase